MITISAKVRDRLAKGIKKFQPILAKAQAADINESDTVTIVTDMLCEVFGWDKYDNVTSEFAVKKTYCDLAVKLDGKVPLLIECKAAGLELKDDHVRQATNYAADAGIEWVVLTNGLNWRIYKILFSKPIDKQLLYDFDFCEISQKRQGDLEMLYYLCIEAFRGSGKEALEELHLQKQILNRYVVAQILLSESSVDGLRKLMRKLYPGCRVANDELREMLCGEVFKREVVEGEAADDARRKTQKAEKTLAAAKRPAEKLPRQSLDPLEGSAKKEKN